MRNKDSKKNKWSLVEKLSALSIIITFLGILSQWTPFLSNKISQVSESFGISTVLMRSLIVLALFVILTLFLSLLCIFKIHKSSNKIDDIDTFHSKNPFLPPKEDMGPLLLEISKSNRFIPDFLSPNFFIKRELLKSYISILTEYKFIKHTGTTEQDRLGAPAKYYSVEPKGYEYLTAYGFLKK